MNSKTNFNKKNNMDCYIKFYADTKSEKNKHFCFKIKSILELKAAIIRFYDKGFNIRACYFQELDKDTGEILNQRIPKETLKEIFDEWCDLNTKHK